MKTWMIGFVLLLSACGGSGGGVDSSVSVVQSVAQVVKARTVVFIGDSITARWPLDDYFRDTININKGVSGDYPRATKARFQSDAIDLHPDIVVILIGTNSPLAQNVQDVIDMANMARRANIVVILCLIPPQQTLDVRLFNEPLKVAALSNGYLLVDYYTPMLLNGVQNSVLFADDGEGRPPLHPNKGGYDVMAAALAFVLSQMLQ